MEQPVSSSSMDLTSRHRCFAGTFVITTINYWFFGLAFLLLDYTQFPKFLMKYKVQPGKNEPPDNKKVFKVCSIYKIT